MLTSTQVAKFVKESIYSKQTQAGIDLSVNKIQKINIAHNKPAFITQTKTHIPAEMYTNISLTTEFCEGNELTGWMLPAGVYSVTFNEGINIPADIMAKITHRSSLYRIGNEIESPWWDAGFYCDNMNTTLIVNTPMFVEMNARLAQIVAYRMEDIAKETYNGQWQGLSQAHKQE